MDIETTTLPGVHYSHSDCTRAGRNSDTIAALTHATINHNNNHNNLPRTIFHFGFFVYIIYMASSTSAAIGMHTDGLRELANEDAEKVRLQGLFMQDFGCKMQEHTPSTKAAWCTTTISTTASGRRRDEGCEEQLRETRTENAFERE